MAFPRSLVIRASGYQFEGQVATTRQIATLEAGRKRTDWLDVCPRAHGNSVPLRVSVEYRDHAGEAHTHGQTIYIPVARTEAGRGSGQVIQINTGGGVAIVGSQVSARDIVGRDKIEAPTVGESSAADKDSRSSALKSRQSAAGDTPQGRETELAETWNTTAIRDLLNAAFDDEELTTLCFDHFRPVYEDFSVGMSKKLKIQRLLDHCDRQGQIEELLALVQKRNPAQYARFQPSLRPAR